MSALQLLSGSKVRRQELWVPPRRLRRLNCENCGLMAQYATWTVLGDGETRDAWLHIHCDYCYQHADWDRAHAAKLEAYQQRKADARGKGQPKLAKVMGL